MTKRSFIKSLIAFSVAPMVLPGAGRLWKATIDTSSINPNWVMADDMLLLSPDGFPEYIFPRVYGQCPWISLIKPGTCNQ